MRSSELLLRDNARVNRRRAFFTPRTDSETRRTLTNDGPLLNEQALEEFLRGRDHIQEYIHEHLRQKWRGESARLATIPYDVFLLSMHFLKCAEEEGQKGFSNSLPYKLKAQMELAYAKLLMFIYARDDKDLFYRLANGLDTISPVHEFKKIYEYGFKCPLPAPIMIYKHFDRQAQARMGRRFIKAIRIPQV